LLFLTGSVYVIARQFSLFSMVEAGYGDSYILYDVQQYRSTGEIYRDLNAPPYLPAQYGPLLYRLYAMPAGLPFDNPFLGPRLVALAVFFLSVSMVGVVVQALIPISTAWLWGVLLAISIKSLENWPIQLRGDFAGIFLSLSAIRLLLLRSPKAALAAGLCAGLAIQFKVTFVAATLSGVAWLLYQKRWRELGIFVAAELVTSGGLIAWFWLHEPRMITQMTAVAPGIRDVYGCILLLLRAIQEPVVLLALPTLPLLLRRWPSWNLLFLYAVAAFAIGGITDVQAGGNINYFYEGLFALIPLSVLGIFRLVNWSRDTRIAAFVTGLILIQFLLPSIRDVYLRRSEANPRTIMAINHRFRQMEETLQGRSIFSTVPRMALLDPHPALMEPYLLTYMLRLGKLDPQPMLERIRREEFDVVISGDYSTGWRGVPWVAPSIGAAIVAAYHPYCVVYLKGALFVFLPRHRPEDSALVQKLEQIPCTAYRQGDGALW
jgi:hypothetical protein